MSTVDPGRCAHCCKAVAVRSGRGSQFWRCREQEADPGWPKYPRLPVLDCARFAAVADAAKLP